MALLHPPVKRSEAAIAGRLIEHRVALGGRRNRLRIALLLGLERVASGTKHEYELVTQDLPGGAQLTVIAMTLAQQPPLAIATAVAEGRKHQRDHRQPVEPRHEIID